MTPFFAFYFRLILFFSDKTINFACVIELERHIEILLLDYDCVIVPDFGGFMAHHVEALYDPAEEILLPPARTIGFNPQLTINDSLLAQSYIEAYDISYPEALKRIRDEVNEIRQHLQNFGKYELNDIGVISLNDYGKYEFEPCEAGILTPELYGLSSIEVPTLATTIKVQTAPMTEKEETEPSIQPEQVEMSLSNTYGCEASGNETIPIRISVLGNIAAACIAVIVFLLFPSKLGNKRTASLSDIHIDKSALTRIMPKDVVAMPVPLDKALSTKKLDRSKREAAPPSNKDSDVTEEAKPYFTLVLASRITSLNAADYVRQLHSKGYASAKILQRKHSIKVIYGSYPSANEAYNELNRMNKNKEFTDSWVLKSN